MSRARSLSELAAPLLRRVDQLCDGFERQWQAALCHGAQRPRLEALLVELPEVARLVGLCELLRVEWAERFRHGEWPMASEYEARLPEFWHAVETLVATLAAVAVVDGVARPAEAGAAGGIVGYRLVRRLGGGTGEVFLATQLFATADDALRTVALKTIRAELLTSRQHRRIMENDIRIAARLDHPHIVRILDVGPPEGPLYYTMPFMPAGSLADRIAGTPLPARHAVAILLPVVQAVDYLHRQSTPVIHLDLKPGNILLGMAGTPHVADFGLARLLHPGVGERRMRRPAGTPQYMAPEQFDGWVSTACDIYGLGAILYEMLTGRPPCVGANWAETMRQAREQPPVPPRALNAAVDRSIEAICVKCLEKDPARRYVSAAALGADLQRYLDGEVPAALKLSWPEWLRRHLDHEVRFEAAATWSAPLLWQAASTFIAYTAVFILLALDSAAPAYWLWLLLVLPAAEWGPWLLTRRGRRYDPREREVLLLWVCVGLAKAILFGLHCPLFGPVRAEEVLRFFPAAMTVNGLMLCLEGRLYWGRLYVAGLLDFLVAVVLASCLALAPLLFGLWNSAVLVAMALAMRRRAGALRVSVPQSVAGSNQSTCAVSQAQ
jgi:hypothetical protein